MMAGVGNKLERLGKSTRTHTHTYTNIYLLKRRNSEMGEPLHHLWAHTKKVCKCATNDFVNCMNATQMQSTKKGSVSTWHFMTDGE